MNAPRTDDYRPSACIDKLEITVAAKLSDVIISLGGMGTLIWEYAGYRRVVVCRDADGVHAEFESRDPKDQRP